MKKRCSSILLTFLLFNTIISAAAAEQTNIHTESKNSSFNDISGHWAEPQITKAVAAGFVNGYSDGTFKPDATVTGEQFLTMMVKALRYPIEAPRSGESWFAPYKQTAVSHKLYNDDYVSGLDQPITRGEITGTLVRATQDSVYRTLVKEEMTKRFSPEHLANQYPFESYEKDKIKIESSPYFKGNLIVNPDNPESTIKQLDQLLSDIPKPKDSLNWTADDFKHTAVIGSAKNVLSYINDGLNPIKDLNEKQTTQNRMIYEAALRGLLTGTGNGKLSLDSKVSRAQAVTLVNRVAAFNTGERFEADKYTVGNAELEWHKTNLVTLLPQYFSHPANGEDFQYEKMISTSPGGKVNCTVEKYVVVDLDDPQDPNRSLVTDHDYGWFNDTRYFKLQDVSGGYAIFSINKVTLTGNPNVAFDKIQPCSASIYNEDWYRTPSNAPDAQSLNRNYGFSPWNPKYEQIMSVVDIAGVELGTITYINGSLIPKTILNSDHEFKIQFSPLGDWPGSVQNIYSSRMK
ncbi:S-layer homology domain-containing protein [Paenibacillus piri]|uniref:S-layer homology domain-containing protein n=1 Tax=Paenibacillus piri TaxID=2547395 RepID=A0A4R5KJX9_9BACL|nr:S-layer homology domain-containing protein [Paenibacillus piri]TDF95452.1 S-layer homology domain-containing protein [Paenibacillus piri]